MQSAKQQLVNAGRKHEAAERQTDLARLALIEAVERAADGGMPKTEIAKLAGISRQSVYDILGAE